MAEEKDICDCDLKVLARVDCLKECELQALAQYIPKDKERFEQLEQDWREASFSIRDMCPTKDLSLSQYGIVDLDEFQILKFRVYYALKYPEKVEFSEDPKQ